MKTMRNYLKKFAVTLALCVMFCGAVGTPFTTVTEVSARGLFDKEEYLDVQPENVKFYSAALLGQNLHIVMFNNCEDVDGYEIQLKDALGKKYTYTVKDNGEAVTTYKNISIKRTVKHVQVRAYKTVDGKKVYSKWVKGEKFELPL